MTATPAAAGPVILTSVGRYINLLDPISHAFHVEEIAHALSHLCRFGGHCLEFYSVAQHSVLVSYLAPEEHAFEALMHDAHEAYVGDIPSPLKRLIDDYQAIEFRVQTALRFFHGLHIETSKAVKHTDLIALATERRDLMPHTTDRWACLEGIQPAAETIHPLNPSAARDLFLARFDQLVVRSRT